MYSAASIAHHADGKINYTIEDLNEELVQLHIPALIFVIISLVVGVIGNIIVLIIYKTKFNRSNHRYFILFLAIIDILACITGLPFLVASLRLPYLMTSVIACKTIRYFHYFVNNSSGLLLVVISIERYMKICRPFKPSLTHRQTLYLCFIPLAISAIISMPAPILFGNNTINTNIKNLNGTQCWVEDKYRTGTPFFEYFMVALMLETAICIVILGVIYTFIIRKLWKSDQFIEAMRSMQLKSSASASHGGKETSLSTDPLNDSDYDNTSNGTVNRIEGSTEPFLNKSDLQKEGNDNVNGTEEKPTSCDTIRLTRDTENTSKNILRMSKELFKPNGKSTSSNAPVKRSISDTTLNKKKQITQFNTLTPMERLAFGKILETKAKPDETKKDKKLCKSRKKSRTTVRVTIMLFTVSLVFVLAFIPHLALMIVTFDFPEFVNSMSKTEIMFYQVFLRLFIINNVANPIIYIFCDSKFRGHCAETFNRCCCCWRRRKSQTMK